MTRALAAAAVLLTGAQLSWADGLKGKISTSAKGGKGDAVKMNADPKCHEQHKAGFQFQPIVVGAKGELADAFVYVKKGLEGKKFDAPKSPLVLLDQKGCWYTPRVAGVMVGQEFKIMNSDPVNHNVNAAPEFNAPMPPTLKEIKKTFKKSKVMLRVKCNIHPWMTSYVGVLDHPYYAVSGKDGSYEIKGLPAGKYTIEVWHEKLGAVEKEVTVGAAGATADFSLSGGKG